MIDGKAVANTIDILTKSATADLKNRLKNSRHCIVKGVLISSMVLKPFPKLSMPEFHNFSVVGDSGCQRVSPDVVEGDVEEA